MLKFSMGGVLIILIGVAIGELIHFLATEKTMTVQLLWAFIPYWLLMVYISLVSAVILHKFIEVLVTCYKYPKKFI